jgi:hypothetical protein
MKKSDLKLEIKNYIYEILSEDVNEDMIGYSSNSTSKNNAKKSLDTNQTFKQLKNLDKIKIKTSIDQDPDGGVINLEEDNNKSAILKKLRGE